MSNALTQKPRKGDYLLYDGKIIYRVTGWLNSDRTIANIQDVKTLRVTSIIVKFGDGKFNTMLEPVEVCDRRCNPCRTDECDAREIPLCPDCLDVPCRCFADEDTEDDEPKETAI